MNKLKIFWRVDMKYKITLIVMTLVAITIAITNEIRIIELKRSFQSQLNRLNSNVTQKKLTKLKKKLIHFKDTMIQTE